jgi:hypothetical protein
MKMFRSLVLVVFCGALVSSCFDPPEYPDAPEITFKSVSYVKGGQPLPDDPSQVAADSIILVLNFKDGDGDVGVSAGETLPPFNDRWYYTKSEVGFDPDSRNDCTGMGNHCYFVNPLVKEFAKYVTIADSRTPKYDTLNPFTKPFNCVNWDVIYYDDDKNNDTPTVPLDTLYFILNPHYNNIFVEFEMKLDNPPDPSYPYETFDEQKFFTYPSCGVRSFYGRIPILSEDLGTNTPLEGEIRYAIPSISFETIFGARTLRLKISIEDRALHRSNTVYTRDFSLRE